SSAIRVPFRGFLYWKHDGERRASAYFAFELDASAMVLNDPQANRQAKPSSQAGFLGSEAGIEYLRLDLLRNTFAVVGDGYANGIILFPGPDADFALTLDSLRSIHQHVHENLIELVRIALDLAHRAKLLDYLDPALELVSHQGQSTFDSFVDIHLFSFRLV